jgi:hypothetical protein
MPFYNDAPVLLIARKQQNFWNEPFIFKKMVSSCYWQWNTAKKSIFSVGIFSWRWSSFSMVVPCPKSLSSFRNTVHICASVADFRNILQNILQYITKGRDTTHILRKLTKFERVYSFLFDKQVVWNYSLRLSIES